jgi:hypothetical protein
MRSKTCDCLDTHKCLRFLLALEEVNPTRFMFGLINELDFPYQSWHSRNVSRVKYQALALKTRAQALIALGCMHEAIIDLRNALDVIRPTADPAMFLQIAATLLAVEGDDALAQEAYATAQLLSAALPNDEMQQIFAAAEPIRQITSTCS